MKFVLLAAAGGAAGSALRYLMAAAITRLLGPAFPWGILCVNILGCFLMGLVVEAVALKLNGSQEARVFLATGVLGGFTTFSAFSLDFVTLMERKQIELALLYVVVSVGLSLIAIYAGMAAGRAAWQ